jgi:hypothetical protein
MPRITQAAQLAPERRQRKLLPAAHNQIPAQFTPIEPQYPEAHVERQLDHRRGDREGQRERGACPEERDGGHLSRGDHDDLINCGLAREENTDTG